MAEFNQAQDYPERYLLFIDILGFREKVLQIQANEKVFSQILGLNDVIVKAGQDAQSLDQTNPRLNADVQITAFSDTVIVSASATSIGLLNVVMAAHNFGRNLLVESALTRGGLARGPLYHKDGTIFGKALLDAYDLERKVAKFARIAVYPEIADQWWANSTGLAALGHGMIRRDDDGVPFVDLFHSFAPAAPESQAFFVITGVNLRRMASDEALRFGDWAKVIWLIERYNEGVARENRGQQMVIPAFAGDTV